MPSRLVSTVRPSDIASHASARALLLTLTSRTLDFFKEHEADNLRRVRAQLRRLLDDKPSPSQSQNLRSAHTMLELREFAFHQAFHSALRTTLEEETQLALPDAPAHVSPPHSLLGDPMHGVTLSLVDMSEVDRIMLIDRVALRFTQHHEAPLNTLTQRLGTLLHLPAPSLTRNPYRPDVFIRSFMQAWDQGGFDPQASDDLLQSLQPQHTVDLSALYLALDDKLADAGVTAEATLRIKHNANQPHSAAKLATASATGTVGRMTPMTPRSPILTQMRHSLTSTARQFLQHIGWQAGARIHKGAIPTLWPPVDPSLLDYLGDLQACAVTSDDMPRALDDAPANHNILRKMRDLAQVRRAPELDRGTVDALAEVFDYVFADQDIPVQMKYIIGRLQIPVLKAAMIDRDFFRSNDHPARRLVDALAHASIAWAPERGETDPLYTRIEQTVKRVLNEFEDDLDLFRDLLQQFTEFLFETEQQAQAAIEKAADQERDRELIAHALLTADKAVHERINAQPKSQPLARFLVPFLTQQWRDVLVHAHLSADQAPQGWKDALATIDQLIWSTQPKTLAEERRQLVAVLPELVRSINQGLDCIEWQGEPRATFTRRLITTHMLAIRMTHAAPADAHTQAQEERAGAQAMEELNARLAPHLSQNQDEFDRLARSFKRGLWFDFTMEDGQPHRCLLSWVSPMRTRLLFTNREGFDAFVRSEREVAALLRLKRLRMVDRTPIVARALSQIMADEPVKLAA